MSPTVAQVDPKLSHDRSLIQTLKGVMQLHKLPFTQHAWKEYYKND